MHWNDPFSKQHQHQVSFAIESTLWLCDQFPLICHLDFSTVISSSISLELWRRHNFPILCCGVTQFLHRRAYFRVTTCTYPYVYLGHAYICFSSIITNILCPTSCDTVYKLRSVALLAIHATITKVSLSICNTSTFLTKFLSQFCFPLNIDCLPPGTSIIFCDNLGLSGTHILSPVCRCISYRCV